jgi:hypothetical protein
MQYLENEAFHVLNILFPKCMHYVEFAYTLQENKKYKLFKKIKKEFAYTKTEDKSSTL